MRNHIVLQKIQIEGPSHLPAMVEFKAGLNAIVGASDTGKSYIFQALGGIAGLGNIVKAGSMKRTYSA